MKRPSGLIVGVVLLAVAACGGNSPGNDPVDEAVGLLSPVGDAAALEKALKSGLSAMSTDAQLAIAADLAANGGNFTGTYTQEVNVDEFDAVRYDGSHLFVAPRRYYHCCHILAAGDGATNTGNDPERSIRILASDPDNVSASPASTIPLEENISVQGMYLNDGQLFALTGESIYGSYGELWTDIAIWAPERLGYRVYDVSDSGNPQLGTDASIDGIFVDSRRIGNTVYIVSRYSPNVEGLHYYVSNAAQQAENEQILGNLSLSDLLPKITINGQTRDLVTPEQCYVTTDDDSDGYPVITTITAVPVDDPEAFSSTCYNEDAYGIYLSETALYLTEQRYRSDAVHSSTRIHKFALLGTKVAYRGSADIDGAVWRGGQADFRMSEHDGDLRVLASLFGGDSDDFVDHKLYVLREAASRPDLDIVSTLPNAQRPAEIGKPNESLYGVRFLADRAYAVTFRQIDPLYAIDLSDPADPFIAGELEITGFSDFLHPVNDALLLGLGSGANGGVKVELFDVSNIAQPLSRGSAVFGNRHSYSEARYDRHAFTYQSNDDGPDRFTIPAALYDAGGAFDPQHSGLHLFEIRDKNLPALASLSPVGSVIAPANGTTIPYYVDRSRAFIHDDTVFYVRDELVWAASWYAPTIVNGPF